MDAAWAEGEWMSFMPPQKIKLGGIETDLLQIPGCENRNFVLQSAFLAAHDNPSPATWKRRIKAGRVISEQPGGPNTLVYVEVAQNPSGIWEPVWST